MPSTDTDEGTRRTGRRSWLRTNAALLACATSAWHSPGAAWARSAPDGLVPRPPTPEDAQGAASPEEGRSAALRLAAAWRGPRIDDPPQVGVLEIPPQGHRVRIASRLTVPSRAHGLTALPDGGFVAVAFRPGHWLLRLDAHGRVRARGSLDPGGPVHLSGHAVIDASGRWLVSTATHATTGEGFVCIHDIGSLHLNALLPTGGIEPHHLALDRDGQLLIAHGGLRRLRDGRRQWDTPVKASLDRLDLASGRSTGQWRLDDADLSIRHLAFESPPLPPLRGPVPAPEPVAAAGGSDSWSGGLMSMAGNGPSGLAMALQAEHRDRDRRLAAPLMARWKDDRLETEDATQGLGGLAGDIAACPGGGHLLSQARAGAAWRVDPRDDVPVVEVARLREASGVAAMAPNDARGPHPAFDGVWIAAAAGLARWHPSHPPRLLAWPEPLAPDSHLAVLAPT